MTSEHSDKMIIDCDTCEVRGIACDDCVVTVLLAGESGWATDAMSGGEMMTSWEGSWDGPIDLDPAEARALDVLAEGGLLPPLRLTRRTGTG
jgi:hypothetical protein